MNVRRCAHDVISEEDPAGMRFSRGNKNRDPEESLEGSLPECDDTAEYDRAKGADHAGLEIWGEWAGKMDQTKNSSASKFLQALRSHSGAFRLSFTRMSRRSFTTQSPSLLRR